MRLIAFLRAVGSVPVREWIVSLPRRARAKWYVRLERLAELGHELRRPESDTLRDGIHELRMKNEGVNYRILYFFHGRDVVVLSHGIVKQRARVPDADIDLAVSRRFAFRNSPDRHAARWSAG